MYTQFQRFIVTIPLFGILLQSCGNPAWKMAESASSNTSEALDVPSLVTPTPLPEAQESTRAAPIRLHGIPKVGRSPEVANTASDNRVTAPLEDMASESAYASHSLRPNDKHGTLVHEQVLAATWGTTTAVSLLFRADSRPAAFVSTSTPLDRPTAHSVQRYNSKKARHGMLPLAGECVGPQQASLPSAHTAPKESPAKVVDLSTAAPKPGPKIHPIASLTKAPITSTPSYVIAQGCQVRFEAQVGTWKAQVQDVWGRVQRLPVVCMPEQTPDQAIKALAAKIPAQHKYCIHILETDQAPWAPRVVYVGALGLRGGNTASNNVSRPRCNYPYAIKAGDNSDDEPDGEVRSGDYSFHRPEGNQWCVALSPTMSRRIVLARKIAIHFNLPVQGVYEELTAALKIPIWDPPARGFFPKK